MAIARVTFDVVEQILIRLEVKDLIRCKRVCKSWYSLISSNSFAKLRLNYSRDNDAKGGHRRVVVTYAPEQSFSCYWLYQIVGSSNGLVFGIDYDSQHLQLTNPLTAELRKLPKPPIPYRFWYGFGYDPCINDYKIIAGGLDSWRCISERPDAPTYFHVFTSSSATWRFIEQLKYGYVEGDGYAVLCDGALHWFMRSHEKDCKVILSFDLSTEEFKETLLPESSDEYESNDDHKLGVFQGCLCIYNHKSSSSSIKWLYNKQQSWELIPCDYEVENVIHYLKTPGDFTPLDHHRCQGICSSSAWDFIRAPIYVESLVSPHANFNNDKMGSPRQSTKCYLRPTKTQNKKRKAKTRSYRYLYPKPFHFSHFSRAAYEWKRTR